MRVFLDTSVLVKRYIKEEGSERVTELLDEATRVVVSLMALPEAVSALRRVYQEKVMTLEQYKERKKELLTDFEDFEVCDLTPEVLRKAVEAIEQYSLRTLDAIHLGCALSVEIDCFVSGDARQLSAARKAKLKIISV